MHVCSCMGTHVCTGAGMWIMFAGPQMRSDVFLNSPPSYSSKEELSSMWELANSSWSSYAAGPSGMTGCHHISLLLTWALGIRTPVLIIMQMRQMIYPLSHLPSPKVLLLLFCFLSLTDPNNDLNQCLDHSTNTANSEMKSHRQHFPAEPRCSNSQTPHLIITVQASKISFSQWISSLKTIIGQKDGPEG